MLPITSSSIELNALEQDRRVSLPSNQKLRAGVSPELWGVSLSVLLHLCITLILFSSDSISPPRSETLPRISWVEFAPIDLVSAVENPDVIQKELAIKNSVSRSANQKPSITKPSPEKFVLKKSVSETPIPEKSKSLSDDTATASHSKDADMRGSFDASGAGINAAARSGQLRVSYESVILSRLERAKRYPHRALQRNLEGEVVLAISIATDGSVIRSEISRSSGHELFDNEVLKMVARAAPFPALPAGFDKSSLDVLIPVVFQIR